MVEALTRSSPAPAADGQAGSDVDRVAHGGEIQQLTVPHRAHVATPVLTPAPTGSHGCPVP